MVNAGQGSQKLLYFGGKMNKKVIIGIVAAVALVFTAVFAYPLVKGNAIKKDPTNYLLYAMTQSYGEAMDMSYNMGMDVSPEALADMAMSSEDPEAMSAFIASIIKELSINARIQSSSNLNEGKFNFYEDFNLSYGKNNLISFNFGFVDGLGFAQSPQLYPKSFVVDSADLKNWIKESAGMDLEGMKLSNYTKHLDVAGTSEYKAFTKGYKAYEPALKEMLTGLKPGDPIDVVTVDNKTIKCDTLVMDADFKNLIKGYTAIMKVAKDDAQLKALAKNVLINLINELKATKDYEKFDLTETDITDALDELNQNFDSAWNEGFDEIIKAYEEIDLMMIDLPEDFKMNLSFAIDKDFKLRQMVFTSTIEQFKTVQTITVNSYGKDVVVQKPKTDATLKVTDLAKDPEQMEALYTEMVETHLPNLIESDAVKNTIDDVKKKSETLPATEKDTIYSMMDMFMENAKDTLMFMPNPFVASGLEDDFYSDEVETVSVGDSTYGTFDIPTTFEAVEADGQLSFTNPETGSTINVYAQELGDNKLIDFANQYAKLLGEELNVADVTATETYFNDYEAYEVYYDMSSDDTVFDTLLFVDSKGVVKIVELITTSDEWLDVYFTVLDSYQE